MTPQLLDNLAAKLSSRKQSERLRVIGILILVLGIAGASVFYWINAGSAGPTIEELLPDYSHARAREIGILMGNFGVTMLGWADALHHPGTQAIIIAAVSALVALGCFRAAHVLDYNEQARARPRTHD